MGVTDELFSRMRRYPDIEAPNLVAVDGADRLILDVAGDALASAGEGRVVVIDDGYGALTLGAAIAHDAHDIRVCQDLLTGELALAANAEKAGLVDRYRQLPLGPELLSGAAVVLLRLPKSLSGLAEIADTIARYADPAVRVFAGGRDKHLSRAMNDVLATSFGAVRASLGRQKSRVLIAEGPRTLGDPPFPIATELTDPDIRLVAHGAAFAGSRLDIGTRFLLDHLSGAAPAARNAVDLGCGTGVLAVSLAKSRTALRIIATDQSAAAVASTRATVAANGVQNQVDVVRDDAGSTIEDVSIDLIVCNPPFHLGTAVHAGAAIKMFRTAGRTLRPSGELWTVFNSHLNYRGVLERLVGPTDVVARNRKFTVTRSVKSGVSVPELDVDIRR